MEWPEVPPEVPRHGKYIIRTLGRIVMSAMGWGIDGPIPAVSKGVLIVAPHTSNWDFVIGIAGRFSLNLDASWLGKHTIFRWPYTGFFRWLGGYPVNRSTREGIVELTTDLFRQREKLILALSPEGTRKKVEKWKTGFYYIALQANVPIVPLALDYKKKRIVFGSALQPSGNLDKDMESIREFYEGASPKYPELFAIG